MKTETSVEDVSVNNEAWAPFEKQAHIRSLRRNLHRLIKSGYARQS